jgi:hypothetical protein
MKYNVCIIGQGPTFNSAEFYENLMEVNVICSTWKGEEHKYEHIDRMVSKDIRHEVLFNDLPDDPGIKNINYQTKSTLLGIELAIERGYDFVFKCRHDMRILNYEKLYKALRLDKFNFVAWVNPSLGGGYLIDYMFGGPTLLMKEYLEMCYPAPMGDFPEQIYTNIFRDYAKDNNIDTVNYILKEAIEYNIFSAGRHAPELTSGTWSAWPNYKNENNRTGKFDALYIT